MSAASASADHLPPLRHERVKGIIMRLAAITGFALMAATIKLAYAHGASTVEAVFYRSLFGLPPLLGWVAWCGAWEVWKTKRPLAHALRGSLGLTSMVLGFTALGLLPLAEASTISFVAPLFALALSSPILAEHVGLRSWLAVAAGFAGVIIVMQPGGDHLSLAGTLAALAAAFSVGCVTVALRSISRTESTPTIVFWFTIFCTVASGALMPWFGQAHDAFTWVLLVLIGLSGGLGQIFLTASLRYAPISALAPIDYLQLVYAVLFGWLLFGDQPAWTTWAGAALIIVSVLSTMGRRPVKETPPSSLEA